MFYKATDITAKTDSPVMFRSEVFGQLTGRKLKKYFLLDIIKSSSNGSGWTISFIYLFIFFVHYFEHLEMIFVLFLGAKLIFFHFLYV